MRSVLTTCSYCGCGCGLCLQASAGKLVGVAPSKDHSVSRGMLCARGWAAHEAASWGERLSSPMVRKNGELRPISWDEALDHAARRLSTLAASPDRIGVLGSARATNEENHLAATLARTVLRTDNIDFCLRKPYYPVLAGIHDVCGRLPPLARLDTIENSDLILLVEGDLAHTHPRAASAVMKALSSGARLVTLGATRTQMSRLATSHLMWKPGLESGVINDLLAAALRVDRDDHTACEGLGALRQRLADSQPTEQAREAMSWISTAERAVYVLTPTNGPAEKARQDAAALAGLAAMFGHLARPGCGLTLPAPRCNWQGALAMGVAPGHTVSETPVEAASGLDAETMIRKVKGIVILATDPLACLPTGERLLPRLSAMECVVILDAFWTPAARAATVILPIAAPSESHGTYISMEGRVQSIRPVLEPPGMARPGWRVLADLCTRLGANIGYRSAKDVLLEIASLDQPPDEATPTALELGWWRRQPDADDRWLRVRAADAPPLTTAEYPWILAREGYFDWGSDPLIHGSPTLSRDFQSKRKLFPGGLLEISKQDADTLGVRQGWKVRLLTHRGIVELPLVIRPDLSPGVLLVPFAFREHAFDAMEDTDVLAARIERI